MLHNNLAVNFKSAKNSLLFVHKSAAHLLCKADAAKDFPDCEVTADGHIHRDVVCKVPSANQQISYVLILQVSSFTYFVAISCKFITNLTCS
ncbi:WDR54 [Bugula neritina]|uniref:WDR54 n=1 Tax=Bugula neritina TaxID=10212 RepID=A0A7J7KTN5_BUGNE|nr:WDR54 [Bugula neritina]